jgi:hypothetical protein
MMRQATIKDKKIISFLNGQWSLIIGSCKLLACAVLMDALLTSVPSGLCKGFAIGSIDK